MTEQPDPQTRAICACDERSFARLRGEFQYIDQWCGWVFVDAPLRRMTPSAQFRAFIDRSEYDHPNHIGEPVVWVTCPFCGGDLPPKDSINPYLGFDGDGQADGEGSES